MKCWPIHGTSGSVGLQTVNRPCTKTKLHLPAVFTIQSVCSDPSHALIYCATHYGKRPWCLPCEHKYYTNVKVWMIFQPTLSVSVLRSFSDSMPHSWSLDKRIKSVSAGRHPPQLHPRVKSAHAFPPFYTKNNSLPTYKPITNLLSGHNLYRSLSIWSRPAFLQFHHSSDWQRSGASEG